MRLSRVLPLAILCFTFEMARGDVLYLRNGTTIEGTVVGQDRKRIRVRVGGRVQTLDKASIRRVSYGPLPDPAAARRLREAEARRLRDEKTREQAQERLREQQRKDEAAAESKRKEAAQRLEESRRKQERERGRAALERRKAFAAGGGTDEGALWRSAVAPGWGLIYKERDVWGYAYAGAFAAGLLASSSQTAHVSTDRAAYQQGALVSTLWGVALRAPELAFVSYSLDRTSRAAYERSLHRHRIALVFVGVIYLAQLAHAYLALPGQPSSAGQAASEPRIRLALVLGTDGKPPEHMRAGGPAAPAHSGVGFGSDWKLDASASFSF